MKNVMVPITVLIFGFAMLSALVTAPVETPILVANVTNITFLPMYKIGGIIYAPKDAKIRINATIGNIQNDTEGFYNVSAKIYGFNNLISTVYMMNNSGNLNASQNWTATYKVDEDITNGNITINATYINSRGDVFTNITQNITFQTYEFVGDINYDGKVNILDIAMVARCFGCDDNQACWPEKNCEQTNLDKTLKNGHQTINIVDVAKAARNFGKNICECSLGSTRSCNYGQCCIGGTQRCNGNCEWEECVGFTPGPKCKPDCTAEI